MLAYLILSEPERRRTIPGFRDTVEKMLESRLFLS